MSNLKSAEEELKEVQMALSKAALGGQSYQIGSRRLTRVAYDQLVARQKELQAQVAAENNSGLFDNAFVAVFDGR